MNEEKKKAIVGLLLILAFAVVLVGIFLPVFGGKNCLEYLLRQS